MKARLVVLLVLLLTGVLMVSRQGAESRKPLSSNALPIQLEPTIGRATASASSAKIHDLAPLAETPKVTPAKNKFSVREVPNPGVFHHPTVTANEPDGAPARLSGMPMPTPSLSFDGLSNFDNIAAFGAVIIPPDTIGDVGPDHYVQAVNALVRIFDKNGNALTQPFKMSKLFAPLGTTCSKCDDGDPVILYDPLADRWLISQYCTFAPPFRQMIAISKTGDPLGDYFLYEFVMPNVRLNDFPKFGVWPDGYYMSSEEFSGSDYAGNGMFAFDRSKMLAGDPTASYIYFNTFSTTTFRHDNVIPSDLDGLTPPPPGTPNIFVGYMADEYGDAKDAVRLFDFHVDFANPASSTFTERLESPIAVAAFDPTSPDGRADISQPPPGEMLDSNSDRVNSRAAYRNFGTSESIVFNQTVRAVPGGVYRAGVRVYELKRTGSSAFAPAEQSTIGDPNSSRWIAAAAEDHQGNLAVEYNYVNDAKPPSIVYTGKLSTEPPGTFRDEGTLVSGTGVQKAFGYRWGDYSGLSVDPFDDCTFWATSEYYSLDSEQFSDFTWLTRIGRFTFPECTPAPRGVISGTVTSAATGKAIAGAFVSTSAYSRRVAESGSYGNLAVVPGTYALTASAAGFRSQTVQINIADGQVVTQSFTLQPVAVIANAGVAVTAESCAHTGTPEPGETVSVNLTLQNTGSLNTQNLVATLVAGGGVTNPGPAQNYGSLTANGAAVTRTFTFTVSPSVICGSPITLTIQLQDGTENPGNVSIDMTTGTPKIAFQQNFDRTMTGSLPQRWTRTSTNGLTVWATSQTRSQSGPKSVFSPDTNQPGISELDSPVFLISTPNARLTFRNWYLFETTFLRNRLYDGSVLEIKIGNADWQDTAAAGGTFESGGYDGKLDSCCQNPLAGLFGWSGRSGISDTAEFISTAVRLPASAAGQKVQLRWRVGTDIGNSIATEGQYIDDIVVTDGFVCSCQNGQ